MIFDSMMATKHIPKALEALKNVVPISANNVAINYKTNK
jgi:hypothetical protein